MIIFLNSIEYTKLKSSENQTLGRPRLIDSTVLCIHFVRDVMNGIALIANILCLQTDLSIFIAIQSYT